MGVSYEAPVTRMAPVTTDAAFTPEEIRRWEADPLVNPRTGRKIKAQGPTFRALQTAAATEAAGARRNGARGEAAGARGEAAGARGEAAREPNNSKTPLSSESLLREVRAKVATDGSFSTPERIRVEAHLRRAQDSYATPLPLFRTLEDAAAAAVLAAPVPYAAVEASPALRKLTVTNCHDGQRKLTLALLDFVSLALQRLRCAQQDVVLVYAGASGLASAVASAVFPALRMVLYDPDPNVISHMRGLRPRDKADMAVFRGLAAVDPRAYAGRRLVVFTDAAGFFNDRVANYCRATLLPRSGARHLLFVSDIRSDPGRGFPSEPQIARDMQDQMRWTMLTGCSAYMHKFRIPYASAPQAEEAARIRRDLGAFPRDAFRVVSSPHSTPPSPSSFPYLDGQLHIQLYGRQRTAELRLVGFPVAREAQNTNATKKRGGTCFAVREYDVGGIEDRMATFMFAYRGHARFDAGRAWTPNPPLPASYEVMAEHLILTRCAEAGVARGVDVAALHKILNDMLATFTAKAPLVCPLISARDELRRKRLDPATYAPHIMRWAEQVLRARPNAAVPRELLPSRNRVAGSPS